jgi:hypothetical protein
MQDVQKDLWLHPPNPGVPRHAFPRFGRSEVHGVAMPGLWMPRSDECLARTKPGAMCGLAHKGRAGAIEVFFNILVVEAI